MSHTVEFRRMYCKAAKRRVAIPIEQNRVYINNEFIGLQPTTNTNLFVLKPISESEQSALIQAYEKENGVKPHFRRVMGIGDDEQPAPSNRKDVKIIIP